MDEFKWCVDTSQDFTQEDELAVSTVNFGNGFRQTIGDGVNYVRRTMSITYTGSEYLEVRAFLRKHALTPMIFTPPGDESGVWVVESVKMQVITENLGRVTADIWEAY